MEGRDPGNRRQTLRLMDWGDLWMETQALVWGTWKVERMETRPETWGPRDQGAGPRPGGDLGL